MSHVIPAGMNSMFSMPNCALHCHVYYGFIQTIPRQITRDNDRIIETIELLGLLLLCGLDCDIYNLISVRVWVSGRARSLSGQLKIYMD